MENISGTWVYPIASPEWVAYHWDVSRAVASAYAAGKPLSLGLYSADGERHSGKYFISSDTNDYNAEFRPTLSVRFVNACDLECAAIYIPLVFR
jgi:hypothetical protein